MKTNSKNVTKRARIVLGLGLALFYVSMTASLAYGFQSGQIQNGLIQPIKTKLDEIAKGMAEVVAEQNKPVVNLKSIPDDGLDEKEEKSKNQVEIIYKNSPPQATPKTYEYKYPQQKKL